jgi:hypothetical protein
LFEHETFFDEKHIRLEKLLKNQLFRINQYFIEINLRSQHSNPASLMTVSLKSTAKKIKHFDGYQDEHRKEDEKT